MKTKPRCTITEHICCPCSRCGIRDGGPRHFEAGHSAIASPMFCGACCPICRIIPLTQRQPADNSVEPKGDAK